MNEQARGRREKEEEKMTKWFAHRSHAGQKLEAIIYGKKPLFSYLNAA